MYQKLYFCFLILLCIKIPAQVKIVITSLPSDTPSDAKIYFSSGINQWNPKDEAFLLKKNTAGNYEISLPISTGAIEYKFTLGSWENAEGDANGNAIPNRSITNTDGNTVIENTILSWQKAQKKEQTASVNVSILSENFYIPQLKTTRRIWVYLPPDYKTTTKKYPVLYMEDGQNLFDNATSFSGEWKVDESLDKFFTEGKAEAIIIGIDNGGTTRIDEYSPWKNQKYGGGKGIKYADFLANTLKPYIDQKFRTLPQPKNTGLMGSSMGGLISFYTGLKYPQKFGKLGIFSPSFWFAEKELKGFLNRNKKQLIATKFYFLAGKKESETMVCNVKDIVKILQNKGVPKENIKTKFDDYGTHSESYWAEEFPAAFLWLFSH